MQASILINDEETETKVSYISVPLTKRNNSLSSMDKEADQNLVETKRDKRKLLWALLISQGVSQLVYMNISTLLPDKVSEDYPEFTSLDVGLLFACYQLVFLIVAPVLGDVLPKFGRRRAIIWGICIITVATMLFASAAIFKNSGGWFFTVSLIARCMQGGADALILISVPSIIAVEWPEKNEVY